MWMCLADSGKNIIVLGTVLFDIMLSQMYKYKYIQNKNRFIFFLRYDDGRTCIHYILVKCLGLYTYR